MSTKPILHAENRSTRNGSGTGITALQGMQHPVRAHALPVSAWTESRAKRIFDCIAVALVLPVLLPALALVAVAVRLTSPGPALFRQRRMGRNGSTITVFKFRTLDHSIQTHSAVTTANNQRFTPIGRLLRRWKLDELPQCLNVLRGDMSLVGPRPKLPEHQTASLPCRPGITGSATLAFACEEALLANIPRQQLDAYYHTVVLPIKQRLDNNYMAHADFWTDLRLILKSIFRRWDHSILQRELCILPVGISRSDFLHAQTHPWITAHSGLQNRVELTE